MESKAEPDKQESSAAAKAKGWNALIPLALFVLAAFAIVCITLYFRTPLLSTYGFYEPDGYFHFSMIREAVLRGFSLSQNLSISGWPKVNVCASIPATCPHHEPFGLYWVTLIPYFFLQYASISYYDIMRNLPAIFGVFDVLGAYLLARYLSKDKLFGLMVMLFVALNMGNAARTSALIYRGDSFIAIFLLLALIATIEIFKNEDKQRKWLFTCATGVLLSFCSLVWTGSAFTTAVYFFAFMLIAFLGFIFDNKKLVKESAYMLVALPIWWLLVQTYTYLRWIITPQTFTGLDFWAVLVPLAIGWYAVHYLVNKRASHIDYLNTPQKRFVFSAVALVVVFLFVYLFVPSLINDIFINNGLASGSNFAATIQEQQLPNYPFLFASFNFQNFINPISQIMMVTVSYFTTLSVVFWLAMLAVSGLYLFMQVEHAAGGFMKGRATIKFEFNESTLILISYFAITAYLQLSAIRFNSLLSIPISIFSAYTVYWVILYLKDHGPIYNTRFLEALASAFIIYLALVINLNVTSSGLPWSQLEIYAFGSVACVIFACAICQALDSEKGVWLVLVPVLFLSSLGIALSLLTPNGTQIFSQNLFEEASLAVSAAITIASCLILRYFDRKSVLAPHLLLVFSICISAYLLSSEGIYTQIGALIASALVAFVAYYVLKLFEESKNASLILIIASFLSISVFTLAQYSTLGILLAFVASALAGFISSLLLKRFEKIRIDYSLAYAALAFFIALMMFTDISYIGGLAPADQINPQFIQALSWLKNNSASNSVVLTLWPDGSVTEGVANRTSVTDSVGSQYAYKANPFAAWLYNSSPDPGFLLSNLSGAPDYFLVRNSWMVETGGIFTESGINVTENSYGYNPFTGLSEKSNATTQVYQFFGSGLEEDTVLTNSSSGQTIASYLRLPSGIQPFEYVDFYNIASGDWSIIKQTAFNITNNQTFLVTYSPIKASNLYVNITAAYMLNTALADSNMIKFLFHCGSQFCTWNNNIASMQMVYVNPDTKIFKIVYNESNSAVKAALAAYPRKPA